MPDPAPSRREPDMAQLLLLEADQALARARPIIEHGGDQITLARELAAAGELFTEASLVIATRARAAGSHR